MAPPRDGDPSPEWTGGTGGTDDELRITDYVEGDREDFARLNREWIERHFRMEEEDRRILGDPRGSILEPGGAILMGRLSGATVATCALIRKDGVSLELAKMAVSPEVRGRGYGMRLGEAAIERARVMGVERVVLETSRRLDVAIRLYEKLGFREVEGGPSPYARSELRMELRLD